jgi:hypothetical protein
MSNKQSGSSSAFPISRTTRNTKYNNPDTGLVEIASEHDVEGGLSKREYIATRLMASLLASGALVGSHAQRLAKTAAECADTLLDELSK